MTSSSSATTRHVVPVVPWSTARITTCIIHVQARADRPAMLSVWSRRGPARDSLRSEALDEGSTEAEAARQEGAAEDAEGAPRGEAGQREGQAVDQRHLAVACT